jgi:hypothetical protein
LGTFGYNVEFFGNMATETNTYAEQLKLEVFSVQIKIFIIAKEQSNSV